MERDRKYKIWDQEIGWIAEPVKEPKLMLGDEVVEIEPVFKSKIICKGESVTKEEWMGWYDDFKDYVTLSNLSSFGLKMSNFSTLYESDKKRLSISKAYCNYILMNITMEQIEAITKALNEL